MHTFSHQLIPIKLTHDVTGTSTNHIVLMAKHRIDAWKTTVCCVYRNDLLMMNNYLFETCRGYHLVFTPCT